MAIQRAVDGRPYLSELRFAVQQWPAKWELKLVVCAHGEAVLVSKIMQLLNAHNRKAGTEAESDVRTAYSALDES